ncbi:Saccharopine dehydrogenase [Ascosphaera pollenicola]|nr:Saccharopine dehydrogenase [Ascosphaera pollenicola]
MDFDACDTLSFFSAADSSSDYPSLPDYPLSYDSHAVMNPMTFRPEINYNEYLQFDEQEVPFVDNAAYLSPFNHHLHTPTFNYSQLSDIGSPYTNVSSPSMGSALLSPPESNMASREASVCMFSPQMQNIERTMLAEPLEDVDSGAENDGERCNLTAAEVDHYNVTAQIYCCPFMGPNGEPCEKGHLPTTQRCKYVRHLDSHYKPFKCEGCRMRFSSKNVYSRHVREQHSEAKYFCTFEGCSRTHGFARHRNMVDHMNRAHKCGEVKVPKKPSGKVQKNRPSKPKALPRRLVESKI